MTRRRTIIIFYFYLNYIFGIIKNRDLKEGANFHKKNEKKIHLILKKTGTAAVTTILVFATVVYLNTGSLNIFQKGALIEILIAFIFLLALFWSHVQISRFVDSARFRELNPFPKAVSEIILVIACTIVISLLLNYIPILLIFSKEAILPVRVRTAFTMSVILSLFFYYFVERERSKKELQEQLLNSARLQKENYQAQLERLNNQVNPHFLFNSLNVLRSLVHQNQEKAVQFSGRLSQLYRSFMKYADEQLVTLQQELEVAKAYIYLLETRFGKAVQFEIDVPSEKLEFQLPPGSLQLLIENAIKHNGSTRKKPLVVVISSEEDELIVKNNLQPRTEEAESTGTGIKNIKSRYKFLTDKEVTVTENDKEFIVTLPLLKVEKDESSHY